MKPEQKLCAFCHGKKGERLSIPLMGDIGYVLLSITPDNKIVEYPTKYKSLGAIKYCPNCGRKLKGESNDS